MPTLGNQRNNEHTIQPNSVSDYIIPGKTGQPNPVVL